MKEKILFDLVDGIGEGLYLSLHIVDITEPYYYGDFDKYRLYSSKGYCFNVERERIEFEDDYTEEDRKLFINGYYYTFQSDLFDGFKTLTIDEAIELISRYKK